MKKQSKFKQTLPWFVGVVVVIALASLLVAFYTSAPTSQDGVNTNNIDPNKEVGTGLQNPQSKSEAGSQPQSEPSSANTQSGELPQHLAKQYDSKRDYGYTDVDHEKLIKSLEAMRSQLRAGKKFNSKEVEALWPQFDIVIEKNFMHPLEAIQIKTWLVSQLDTPNASLSARLDTERKVLASSMTAEIKAERSAYENDPKRLAYKAKERQLTKAMLEKYPDDNQKASQELEKALDKVRTEIYRQ